MHHPLNCRENEFKKSLKRLEKLLDECNTEIALRRDFNFSIINWQNEKINGSTKSEQDQCKLSFNLLNKFNLCQIIQ